MSVMGTFSTTFRIGVLLVAALAAGSSQAAEVELSFSAGGAYMREVLSVYPHDDASPYFQIEGATYGERAGAMGGFVVWPTMEYGGLDDHSKLPKLVSTYLGVCGGNERFALQGMVYAGFLDFGVGTRLVVGLSDRFALEASARTVTTVGLEASAGIRYRAYRSDRRRD